MFTPKNIAKMDQANAELDANINITLNELKEQFAEGYSEEMITLGLYEYLTRYSELTRAELNVAYMRVMIRLAQAEKIDIE